MRGPARSGNEVIVNVDATISVADVDCVGVSLSSSVSGELAMEVETGISVGEVSVD